MDAAAELGRNPVSKHQIQPEYGEMSKLTRDGTAEPVSRDQIIRHARGQGNLHFPCSADHEQDWQPYPVDPYSAIWDDHTYIHTYLGWCVLCAFSSHSFWTSSSLDVPAGVTQDFSSTLFLRLVRSTNLTSRMNGKKPTHTIHTDHEPKMSLATIYCT